MYSSVWRQSGCYSTKWLDTFKLQVFSCLDKRKLITQDNSRILSSVCTGEFVVVYSANRIAVSG